MGAPRMSATIWRHRWQPSETTGIIAFESDRNGDPDDYYYVDLASATPLVLDLTNLPSGTDYDLVLYNAAGGELAQSRNAGRISQAVSAGRYFVRVYPYSGRSPLPYRLTGHGAQRRKGSRRPRSGYAKGRRRRQGGTDRIR